MTNTEQSIINLFDGVVNDMLAISPAISADTMASNVRNFHYALLDSITRQIQAEGSLESEHPLYETKTTLIGMGNKWLGNKERIA